MLSENKKQFLKTHLNYKDEWFEFYGSHIRFEEADNNLDFNTMMNELAENPSKCEFLLNHLKATRPVFGEWAIESFQPFCKIYGQRVQKNLDLIKLKIYELFLKIIS